MVGKKRRFDGFNGIFVAGKRDKNEPLLGER